MCCSRTKCWELAVRSPLILRSPSRSAGGSDFLRGSGANVAPSEAHERHPIASVFIIRRLTLCNSIDKFEYTYTSFFRAYGRQTDPHSLVLHSFLCSYSIN